MTTTFFSPSATPVPYGNSTTLVNATVSCYPCNFIKIEPNFATWSPAPSLPAIATRQLIIDPNDNTTSTSVICNTELLSLSAYQDNCLARYTVDENCDLVAQYAGVDNGGLLWATA